MPMKKDDKAAVSEERPVSLEEAVKSIKKDYKEDLNQTELVEQTLDTCLQSERNLINKNESPVNVSSNDAVRTKKQEQRITDEKAYKEYKRTKKLKQQEQVQTLDADTQEDLKEFYKEFLTTKFDNIKIEPKKQKKQIDRSVVHKQPKDDNEIEDQMMKCRQIFMKDIHEKIDRYRIETMRKLSQFKYDEVQTRPDEENEYLGDLIEDDNLKLYKMHQRILTFKSYLSMRNIFIALAAFCLFFTYVLPEMVYIFNMFDRHYFGYFNEQEPVFAKSTQHKNYYTQNNIPFHTYEDREREKNEHYRRLQEGLPPVWNHHRERAYNQTAQYGATALAKSFHRKLQSSVSSAKAETCEKKAAGESTPQDPFEAKYPKPYMTEEQIRSGGFLLYLIGIMYSFLGISLVTQNYINPAIDIIKKKGIMGSDTMNATLLALSNSAAESFIVMNSIFFGVPDIGIQTAVQQCAFSALIIQGFFYSLAPEKTRIDWWISTRDAILFIFYLALMSFFMSGNQIENYAIYTLLLIYIIHVVIMKMNHTYEVALKKNVANALEVDELNRLANEDITHFHYNLEARTPPIEVLNKIQYKREGDVLIFENTTGNMSKQFTGGGQFMARQNNQIRYRMRPIKRIKIGEERFANPDDVSLMARARLKRAVIKILTKLQAFNIYEKIKRNKHCVIPISKFVKDYHPIPQMQQKAGSDIYGGGFNIGGAGQVSQLNYVSSGGESDDMFQDEESSSQELSEYGNNSQEDMNLDSASRKPIPKELQDELDAKKKNDDAKAIDGAEEYEDNEEQDKIDWQQIFLQEKVMGEPQSIPQSIIYELVNETINKEAFSIQCPEQTNLKGILQYILFMPLTHTQYITIPSPLSKKNDNFYPLTLVLSIIWIFAFAYIIVWFTYDVTVYLGLQYSFIPMFIYPFGVSIRDFKKFNDFQLALEVFKKELPDQEISLAESYAPQIFQMTGLAGTAWFLNLMITDTKVVFKNDSIQFQVPILIGVVIMKYMILAYNRFKTRKSLFKANCYGFLVFVIVVLIIEYKNKLFGSSC